MIRGIQRKEGFTVTINTTEDCNLRCKYCYEINKCNKNLSVDKAKKFIDMILGDPDPACLLNDKQELYRNLYKKGIIFDFIGGDALIDVNFLDEMFSYISKALLVRNYPNKPYWNGNYMFSLSTNGTLFKRKEVRDFCEKWRNTLSLGVSIDGCPEIHDLNRVYPDGRGSMKDVLEWWPWYQKTFPGSSNHTKATCNRDSIYYLYDSLKFMHEEMNINKIYMNFIMEDTGCTEEDYKELDNQLGRCIQYVLDHDNELYWSMLDDAMFAKAHLSTGLDWKERGWCGSGAMPALGIDGKIYPCFRWLNHTQNSNVGNLSVGSIEEGLNHKENFLKVREGAYRCNCTKDEKCRSCEFESACSYCIGGCYSEFGEFKRTTYICEITKLLVKWARIYWQEYNKKHGLPKINWEEEIRKYGQNAT